MLDWLVFSSEERKAEIKTGLNFFSFDSYMYMFFVC